MQHHRSSSGSLRRRRWSLTNPRPSSRSAQTTTVHACLRACVCACVCTCACVRACVRSLTRPGRTSQPSAAHNARHACTPRMHHARHATQARHTTHACAHARMHARTLTGDGGVHADRARNRQPDLHDSAAKEHAPRVCCTAQTGMRACTHACTHTPTPSASAETRNPRP